MALDDYMEPEVGIAVVLTAAVASPKVRRTLRKGAVYGLAGLMMAGDTLTRLARSAASGLKDAAGSAADKLEDVRDEVAPRRKKSRLVVEGAHE